tara:strand:- start:571 stop:708 length:138 start_codon:yes stop_codon:yes gene_type:complete
VKFSFDLTCPDRANTMPNFLVKEIDYFFIKILNNSKSGRLNEHER